MDLEIKSYRALQAAGLFFEINREFLRLFRMMVVKKKGMIPEDEIAWIKDKHCLESRAHSAKQSVGKWEETSLIITHFFKSFNIDSQYEEDLLKMLKTIKNKIRKKFSLSRCITLETMTTKNTASGVCGIMLIMHEKGMDDYSRF